MSESDEEDGAGAAEAAAQAAAVAAAQADGANVVVESASRPSAGAACFRLKLTRVLALRRLRACIRGDDLAMCATTRSPALSRAYPFATRHFTHASLQACVPLCVCGGSRDPLCQRAGLTRVPRRRPGAPGGGGAGGDAPWASKSSVFSLLREELPARAQPMGPPGPGARPLPGPPPLPGAPAPRAAAKQPRSGAGKKEKKAKKEKTEKKVRSRRPA